MCFLSVYSAVLHYISFYNYGFEESECKGSAEKKMMSIELKREIIEKHEQGVRMTDLARQYKCSTSPLCTAIKQKVFIKGMMPGKGVRISSKLWTSLQEKMEKLLMV